jgi:MFS family permease
MLTLALYMAATLATAFAQDFLFLALCRFVTGLGIGGEYAAINSAIDELVPARVRGRVNLIINASFWIGAALGGPVAGDPGPARTGCGAGLARLLPAGRGAGGGDPAGAPACAGKSALAALHRHHAKAERWCGRSRPSRGCNTGHCRRRCLTRPRRQPVRHRHAALAQMAQVLLHRYRARSVMVALMMVAQAFVYNAIFFTYALVLTRFFQVPDKRVALYIFPSRWAMCWGRWCWAICSTASAGVA